MPERPKGKELIEWTVLIAGEVFAKRLNLNSANANKILDPSEVQIVMPRTIDRLFSSMPESNGMLWRGLAQVGLSEDLLRASYYHYMADSPLTRSRGYISSLESRGLLMEIGVFNSLKGKDEVATDEAAKLAMETLRHNYIRLPEEKPLVQDHWRATANAQLKRELLDALIQTGSTPPIDELQEVVRSVVFDPSISFTARGALIFMRSAGSVLEYCFNQQLDVGLRNLMPRDFKQETLLNLGKQLGLNIDYSNVQDFLRLAGLIEYHNSTGDVARNFSLPTTGQLVKFYIDSSIPERIAGDIK